MEIIFLQVYSVLRPSISNLLKVLITYTLENENRKAITGVKYCCFQMLGGNSPHSLVWFMSLSLSPAYVTTSRAELQAVYLDKHQSLGRWSVLKRLLILCTSIWKSNGNCNKEVLSLPLLSGLSKSGNTKSRLPGNLELPLPVLDASRSGETWQR